MRGQPWRSNQKWRFCPWCGIEWVGEHLASEKSKRRKELIYKARELESEQHVRPPIWEIQRRIIWPGDPPTEWHSSGYWVRERKDVVSYYKSLVETEDEMDEYRVVRIYLDGKIKEVLGPERGRGWLKCGGCGTKYQFIKKDRCPRCGRME
jgi:hypothetical protein